MQIGTSQINAKLATRELCAKAKAISSDKWNLFGIQTGFNEALWYKFHYKGKL
jgi:hypothetical protein